MDLSSVENLHRLVLEGGDVRHINKLVDIYNLLVIEGLPPINSYKLRRRNFRAYTKFFQPGNRILISTKKTNKPGIKQPGTKLYKNNAWTVHGLLSACKGKSRSRLRPARLNEISSKMPLRCRPVTRKKGAETEFLRVFS